MARITTRWLAQGGLRKLGLSTHEGWVLVALVERADRDGIAWPSQYTIATDLGIARSTVQLALARLVEVGAIVEHEPGRQGRSARYRIAAQLDRRAGQLAAVN
ncbi:helix-turn-helix domain-containing protein [Microbacterium sp. RURRCA19A]|uniref:helix-turn-helix domain-containing protein n=1 Tax=Microbacterium sp. RURRCA19A TaxID=1907391 RepID=UPI000956B378|nr:helix-turn-helix domain-containing protein [Microbacterium sp. RURRCA19A]SIS19668.1 Helix-turn-helix domain-containing protein [Microbacterium sp. RURRCA19A]